ncbi:glycoprotein [Yerba mate chlorosis-associated virus]|uniref:Glycoprotein n=1 Tax=Yerba mate chlorosis-associated virus TaxID=2487100 RepID=A0A1W5RXZ3_9RHAB|nr:glycoprotein [Yerba mate chlorosis-associated virus]ARA91090.1 glycoprotein [Yerba mate chlorosis-associated virus]
MKKITFSLALGILLCMTSFNNLIFDILANLMGVQLIMSWVTGDLPSFLGFGITIFLAIQDWAKEVKNKIKRVRGITFSDSTKHLLLITYLIIQLLLLKQITGEEISLHMPKICNVPVASSHLTHASCFRSCDLDGISKNVRNITIYKQDSHQNMLMVECQIIRSSIKATETWTFSQFSNIQPDEVLDPDPAKCWATVRDVCMNSKCETKKPEIVPEYHYASDHIQYVDWAHIKYSMKTIPFSHLGKSYIRIEGNLVEYEKGFYISVTNPKLAYLWEVKTEIECYTEPLHTYQCNQVDKGGSISYLCGRSSLWLKEKGPVAEKFCNHDMSMVIDETGIMYSYTSMPQIVKDGLPIYQSSFNEALRVSTLSARVNNLIQEETECRSNCLNFRAPDEENPSYYGKIMIGRYLQGYYMCYEDPSCKISFPLRVCSNKNLVAIICKSEEMWWDPTKLLAYPMERCNGDVTTRDSVSFLSGGNYYRVNKTGVTEIGGIEIRPQDHHVYSHLGLAFIDTETIKQGLTLPFSPLTANELTKEEKTEVHRWNFGIKAFLSSIDHTVKKVIVLSIGTISILILLIMMINLLSRGSKKSTNKYHQVSYVSTVT